MISPKLLIILSIVNFFLMAFYTPPPQKDVRTTKASSTRGCPERQGELYLIGHQIETHQAEPILLFWLAPAKPNENLLVVVKNENLTPIFSQKIAVRETGYLSLKLSTEIEPNIPYTLVAGFLCQERVLSQKVLMNRIILWLSKF